MYGHSKRRYYRRTFCPKISDFPDFVLAPLILSSRIFQFFFFQTCECFVVVPYVLPFAENSRLVTRTPPCLDIVQISQIETNRENLAKTNSSIISISSFLSTHRAEPGNADGGVVDSTATEVTNVVIDNLGGNGSYSNVVSMAAGEQNCPDTAAACVKEVGFDLGLVTETTSAIRPDQFSAKSEV